MSETAAAYDQVAHQAIKECWDNCKDTEMEHESTQEMEKEMTMPMGESKQEEEKE